MIISFIEFNNFACLFSIRHIIHRSTHEFSRNQVLRSFIENHSGPERIFDLKNTLSNITCL